MGSNLPTNLQTVEPGFRLVDLTAVIQAFNQMRFVQSQSAITASTTQTQAGGRGKLTRGINVVETANSNDAVTMPNMQPGDGIVIVNISGQTIQVFPETGQAINAAGNNNAVTIANNTTSDYYCGKTNVISGGATTNET